MCVCVCVGMALTVVSVSDTCAVGRGFAPGPGHIKDHYRYGTNCLPAWHAYDRVGVLQ